MNNDYQNTQNTQTDMELENMRQQMNTLKKKLEQQEIVNDGLMRRSMKNTAGNISRRYYLIMALCLLMIPYSYWAFVKLNGFSVPFWIFTSITMLVSFGGTYYNSRKLSDSNLMTNNLVDVRRSMARARSSMPTGSSSAFPSPSSFLAGLCTSPICFIPMHFSTDSSGQVASAVSLELSGDSLSTSRHSASIRILSTRLRISLQNSKYGCHIHSRPLTTLFRRPAAFLMLIKEIGFHDIPP